MSHPLRQLLLWLLLLGVSRAGNIHGLRSQELQPGESRPGVSFEGVVNYAHPREPVIVVQDDSDGIWCPLGTTARPENLGVGSRVRVSGKLQRGNFGALCLATNVTVLGQPGPPPARPLAAADLQGGTFDCQFVEVTGIVRAVVPWPNTQDTRAMVHLDSAGTRLRVLTSPGLLAQLGGLVDALVRVRGVCVLSVNSGGQVLNAQLRIARRSQIEVLAAPRPEEELPLTLPVDLLAFGAGDPPRHRVRTRGVVTALRRDEWVQIQAGTRGVRVWTHHNPDQPELGDSVEVIGFPVPGPFTPQIEDGEFRPLDDALGAVQPVALGGAAAALQHDGELVRVRARLVEAQTDVAPARLVLDADGTLFAVELPHTVPRAELPALPGALLEATGVAEVMVGKEWQDIGFPKPRSFLLHLRNLGDLAVLQPAPWWTPPRLAAALAAAVAALLTVLAFAGLLSRKNRRLQAAEAALARRVEMRTDQLQAQISARRDEFTDYAIVTAERNRLARDLHDSLEQTLAGAALRLEASLQALPQQADSSRTQIDKAAELLRLSQGQVRQTVWGLRSLALEKRTLADALRESVQLLTDDSGLTATLDLDPRDLELTPEQESELLHIAHEAIANILKHARATRLTLSMRRHEQGQRGVTLLISDDGCGFDPAAVSNGLRNGRPHYGLQDLHERARLIGARLEITSRPGGPTEVQVDLSFPAP